MAFTKKERAKLDYGRAVRRAFWFYGFHASPLTTTQISNLFDAGITEDEAFGIGCDVASGYAFPRIYKRATGTFVAVAFPNAPVPQGPTVTPRRFTIRERVQRFMARRAHNKA